LLRVNLPACYNMEVMSDGKKISTRQRRKLTMELNLPRTTRPKDQTEPSLLVLFLVYHTTDRLSAVYLLERVFSKTNPFSSVRTSKKLSKRRSIVENTMNEKKPSDMNEAAVPATPLRQALGNIMCNLALVRPSSFCFDPFVGSGSLLNACQRHRAVVIGADALLDHVFRDQCGSQERILSNVYTSPLRDGPILDAILCDPPYGRREKHVDKYGHFDARHETNEARALAQFQILKPLFLIASLNLRPGGRLVFGFFNFPNSDVPGVCWDIDDLPKHKNLKVTHICREKWEKSSGHILARDIVTVQKIDTC